MIIDPTSTSPRDMYRLLIGLIVPRPIAWVSTLSAAGVTNLAPFSFFNGISASPPSLLFCPANKRDGSKKDTLLNVEATREFVVNVVPFALAEPMNGSAADYAHDESEFDALSIAQEPSVKVKAPRVKNAPVHIECVLHQVVHVGEGPLAGNVVIGRIVWIDVRDELLDERGDPDPRKLDAIGRMGGIGYARTTDLFTLPRPQAPARGNG
jgi:flavin reductase (DIM6/NTAB) family NADH-FMN oxidoreductase RutF